jgi:RNA polymerase sigma factor for flagellar operon FliA
MTRRQREKVIEIRVQAQRDKLILDHLPLVKAIANRIHESLPVHVDLDDMVHAGILGMMDAADKFDQEKNVKFATYAKYRIRGAILDSLRGLDWASRDMRRNHKQVEAAKRDLSAVLKRDPTELEIVEKLGVTEERWRSISIDLRNVGLVSSASNTYPDSNLPTPEFAASPNTYPDAICINEQLGSVLKEALKILPPRYRKVVTLYYKAEMTMKEIGDILGVNESRVSQMRRTAMEKLQAHLSKQKLTFAALA